MPIRTIVDVHEDMWFAAALQDNGFAVDQVALPEGDFWLVESDGTVTAIERKTWGDAMASWKSKRLGDQLSRIIENCNRTILIVEGSPDLIWGASKSEIASLQAHLNRLSAEVCPVLYVADREGIRRQIAAIRRRLDEGHFGYLIRPVTVVATTRNKHSSLLERIPRVGRGTAQKIMGAFESVADFVANWGDPDRAPLGPKTKTWASIDDFLNAPWQVPTDVNHEDRETIISIEEDGSRHKPPSALN